MADFQVKQTDDDDGGGRRPRRRQQKSNNQPQQGHHDDAQEGRLSLLISSSFPLLPTAWRQSSRGLVATNRHFPHGSQDHSFLLRRERMNHRSDLYQKRILGQLQYLTEKEQVMY